MQKGLMKTIVSAEYLFAAVLIGIFFVAIGGFEWWWLIILFLIVDVSAVGYLYSNRLGALTYNIGHSLIGPTILTAYYVINTDPAILFIILIWLFHILVDRALGFGLKHTKSFHHTHLGKLK